MNSEFRQVADNIVELKLWRKPVIFCQRYFLHHSQSIFFSCLFLQTAPDSEVYLVKFTSVENCGSGGSSWHSQVFIFAATPHNLWHVPWRSMPIGLACCRWAGAAPFTAWAITIEIIEVSDTGHDPERPVSRCGHNTQMCLAFTTSVGIQGAKEALGSWVLSFYGIKVTCRIALATKVVPWASLAFFVYNFFTIIGQTNFLCNMQFLVTTPNSVEQPVPPPSCQTPSHPGGF